MNETPQPGYVSTDMPDRVLLHQALQGDQDSFAHLVNRYHAVLVGYITSWSPDPFLVPDIEQETVLRLYCSLPTLRTDQPLRAWLLRVAYYACMSERRRRKPLLFSQVERSSAEEEASWLANVADPDPSPEECVEQQEASHVLSQAIAALPFKQRMAIRLKYLDQLSYRALAQALGIPEGTAKTYVARAKPVLRQFLTSGPSAHP